MKNPLGLWLLLLSLILIGVSSVIFLLYTEFSKGEDASEYSSYSTKLWGTKALYEAFENLSPLQVRRQILDWTKLGPGQDSTLWIIGADDSVLGNVSVSDYDVLQKFLSEGGHLVLALNDQSSWPRPADAEVKKSVKPSPAKDPDPEKAPTKNLLQLLDFSVLSEQKKSSLSSADYGADILSDAQLQNEQPALPSTLPWQKEVYFAGLGTGWKTMYSVDNHPVIIERLLGPGRITILAGSFLLSNEGLSQHPEPGLLGWIVGSSTKQIFEETIHGFEAKPGVISIARHFHLQGFFLGLIPLLGVFVWKSQSSFIPRQEEATPKNPEILSSRNSLSGLTHLLAQRLPRAQLLSTCLDEWEWSLGQNKSGSANDLASARNMVDPTAVPRDSRSLCSLYQSLTTLLSSK